MNIFRKMKLKTLFKKIYPLLKVKINSETKTKFKLPELDLLKIPTKKERENFEKNETHDPEFLEKILDGFWC